MEGAATKTVPKFRLSKAPSSDYGLLIEHWKNLSSTTVTIDDGEPPIEKRDDDSSPKSQNLDHDQGKDLSQRLSGASSSGAVKFPRKMVKTPPAPFLKMETSSVAGGEKQKKKVKFVTPVRERLFDKWRGAGESSANDAGEPEQMETDYNERHDEDDESDPQDELEKKLMDGGDNAVYADVEDLIFDNTEMVAKLKPFMDKVDRRVRMYTDQIYEVDSSDDEEADCDDVGNYADLENAGEQEIPDDGHDDNCNNPSTANVEGDHKTPGEKKFGLRHHDHRNRKSGRRSGPNFFFDVKPSKKDDECDNEEILKMRLSRLPRRLGMNNMKVEDLVIKVQQLRAEQKAYLEERQQKIFEKANNRKKTYCKSLKTED